MWTPTRFENYAFARSHAHELMSESLKKKPLKLQISYGNGIKTSETNLEIYVNGLRGL